MSDSTINRIIREQYGADVNITRREPVFGGDINRTCRLQLSDGRAVFMKENQGKAADFFTAEAEGLRAIASTGQIGTIDVIGTGEENSVAFLLLSYVDGAKRIPDFWEVFGSELANMHLADPSAFVPGGSFGFTINNFIGATRQINTPCNTWIDFYRQYRLEVQFHMASSYFDREQKIRINHLLDRLDRFLVEPKQPSLLHGDLWSGNFMVGNEGKAILIDPAVYVGHPEADLAMTELFGGFREAFYTSYQEKNPLQPGYADRRDLYNLYQLLNHLNLFGGSYYGSVMRIVDHYA
ncbi:MAG: fructosamine kinase family protein [Lachnospiraceae bacterium]|nr:fructosamine kinase family protein [Lachnospiraceae bacterium]